MNKLIISNNESLTMSSREIAELTGKMHRHVFRDADLMLIQLGLETTGYVQRWTHPQNNQCYNELLLPEDLTLTLVSGYNVKLRKVIVDKWIEIRNKPLHQIPQTLGEALQLAADQAKQLELQAPKVAFVDNCVERGQLMTATQVAQKHKMSAVKLNKFLLEHGGVYNKAIKRSKVFLTAFVIDGFGEMKQTELGYSQCLFTAKGEQWIHEKLINEGVI